ncbi:riboflavin synthase [Agilicoccus flavus]|uniref:riboflavin synthase n=1 Tax=Agilicoccus flavus TaxID=2775968 RepID=UPI001CF691D0|nr:riboflavin synthase [Agilicoccus flavus]
MFTGIVEELGRVEAIDPGTDSAVLRVRGPLAVSDAAIGSSIAVNGVCLTVTGADADAGTFAVDVMAETLNRSSLGDLAPGDPVNLERAMRADRRFGGHVVQGHVDGTGTILRREPGYRWEVVTIALPAGLRRYVVEKGSICVDGTSLTVSALDDDSFSVGLIPTTLAATTLGSAGVGARVNLEVDVLAKYVENMLATNGKAPS